MKDGDTLRTFPVLWPSRRADRDSLGSLLCPDKVPWDLVAAHADQCQRNHSQSPQRLSERGGLAVCEMVAVLDDRRWRSMSDADAVRDLRRHVDRWEARQRRGLLDPDETLVP